jgi:outer membrane protein
MGPAWRALGALGLAIAATGPARAIDLVDSYLAAQTHDPILAAAQAAHTAGVEAVPQAQAKLLATVQATGTIAWLDTHLTGLPPTTGYTTQGLVSLNQPLFNRPNWVAVDQAHSQVVRLDSVLVGAEQDLVVRVAHAYFDTLLAQDLLEATLQEKESIGEQLARAKRAFEVGTEPITDVTDAQARYDLAVAQEARDRGGLEISQRAFEILTGAKAEMLAGVVPGAWQKNPEPNDIQFWVSAAQTRNPGVVQSAATLDVKQRDIDRTRGMWWPTVDLVANYSKQDFSRADLNVLGTGGKQAEIGIQVGFTIYDGGLRSSLIRQARASADEASDNLQSTRNMAVQLARQSFVSGTSSLAEVHALEQAVESGRVSLQGAIRGFEAGTRTAVDVLNARQLLFQALRQLAAAHYNVLLYRLQLKSATGDLSARDLDGMTSASAPSSLFSSQPPIPR